MATGAAIVASRLTAANTNLVSERDGGALSVQDSGAQTRDTFGDQVSQQGQEDSQRLRQESGLSGRRASVGFIGRVALRGAGPSSSALIISIIFGGIGGVIFVEID